MSSSKSSSAPKKPTDSVSLEKLICPKDKPVGDPLVKIRQAFRQYELPEPGIYKANARYQYHFYKALHPNHLNFLKRYKHLISYNLEAPRYWLYLTTNKSGQPKAYYLNANLHQSATAKSDEVLISGRHRLSPELFQETIIEGQLVTPDSGTKPIFLISDLLVYKGQAMLNQHSYTYRLSCLDSILKNHWQPDSLIDTYDWQLKTQVEMEYLNAFWTARTGSPTGLSFGQISSSRGTETSYQSQINGLVFRPNAKSLRNFTIYLTQPHCYSFTDSSINQLIMIPPKSEMPATVSTKTTAKPEVTAKSASAKTELKTPTTQPDNRRFLVVPDARPNKPDVYYLYQPEGDSRKQLATVTSLANSLKIRELFQTNQANLVSFNDRAGLYFECQYRSRFRKWEPISFQAIC